MAKINKKEVIAKQQGLPTKEQILTAPANTDKVPAHIQGMDGSPKGPAALTEGEFVWSIPAIVALGQGSYDEGVGILEQMHGELRLLGEEMLGELEEPQPTTGLPSTEQLG